MTLPITASADSPAYLSPEYEAMRPGWERVRLVRDLNESIKTKSATVLPRYEAEGLLSWTTRRDMTFAFEAVDETIHALVGLATRHPPVLGDDVPKRLRLEWEDLDGQGTHGDVVVQHLLDLALQDGHAAVLVDCPPSKEGLNAEEEARAGIRAYVVLVPIDRITAWRTGRVLGRHVVTMVKLREDRQEVAGAFGTKTIPRYRTLYQNLTPTGEAFVTYVVHEEVKGKPGEWYVSDEGRMRGPTFIPLYGAYGGEQTGLLTSKPPLRGLAFTNLDHTQVGSDLRYSMHKCAIPVPIFVGRVSDSNATDATIVLSSDNGLDMMLGGDAKYLEPTGAALEALRVYRTDLKLQMGSQGFSMLRRESTVTTTATEKTMQASREESKLSKAVRSVNDAMEGVLGAMAAFYRLPKGGSITMDRNFTDVQLTADDIRVLADLEATGRLTLDTLLAQIQRGSRVLEGVDIPKEVGKLKLEASASADGSFRPETDPAQDKAA